MTYYYKSVGPLASIWIRYYYVLQKLNVCYDWLFAIDILDGYKEYEKGFQNCKNLRTA